MKIFQIGWFILSFLSLESVAQNFNFAPPLAIAMGGSGRAIVEKGAEYHLINPAGVALARKMQSAGFYAFGESIKPYWGLSISELQTAPIALSFIKEWDSTNQKLILSFAGLVLPGFSLGLSIHRQQLHTTNWNAQAGLLIKPKGQNRWSIGSVYDQILPSKPEAKNDKKWGVGINYQIHPTSNFQVDGVYHFSKKPNLQIIIGIESLLSQFLVLRGSSQWNQQTNTWIYAGGIGLKGTTIQADYSVSQYHLKNLIHAWTIRATF